MLYNLTLLKRKLQHSNTSSWYEKRSECQGASCHSSYSGAPTGCSANAPGVAELINLEVNLTMDRLGRGNQDTKVSKSVFAWLLLKAVHRQSFRRENNSIATQSSSNLV